ncbi:MAG: ACT domain-containing protein [Acidimicrobiales bacterium]
MRPDADLDELLAAMSPRQQPGEYFFVVDAAMSVKDQAVLASVVEPEGRSIVVSRQEADHQGLPYDFVAGWITLEVRSALDAVGLSAAVTGALSEAGISCNVVAGYHHDHLLVPYERVDDAIDVLQQLSVRHRPAPRRQPSAGPGPRT